MAYTPFKMKGHTLPGIKQRKDNKMEDGRPGSSAFQYKKPPTKWVQYIPMAISAISALRKAKKDK
tara:strand:+ start:1372 stop:1566 length:195 start_codon:yes stop_codon:yes gene_type:complete